MDTYSITNTATVFDSLYIDALCVIVKQIDRLLQKNMWAVLYKRAGDKPIPYTPNASEILRLMALLFSENSPFHAVAALFSTIQQGRQYFEIGIYSSARMLIIGPDML